MAPAPTRLPSSQTSQEKRRDPPHRPSCPTSALPGLGFSGAMAGRLPWAGGEPLLLHTSGPGPRGAGGAGAQTPALIPLGLKPSLISPPVPWRGASLAPLHWGTPGVPPTHVWGSQHPPCLGTSPPKGGHVVPARDGAWAMSPPHCCSTGSPCPAQGGGHTLVLLGALMGTKGAALSPGGGAHPCGPPWGAGRGSAPPALCPQGWGRRSSDPPNLPKPENEYCVAAAEGPGLPGEPPRAATPRAVLSPQPPQMLQPVPPCPGAATWVWPHAAGGARRPLWVWGRTCRLMHFRFLYFLSPQGGQLLHAGVLGGAPGTAGVGPPPGLPPPG